MNHELAGKRIALYARYSSEHQSERSCADQLARLVTEVERRGGHVPSDDLVFQDKACSGASTDRPEFLRLLRAIDEHRVDVIMIEDLSRLGRAQADLHLMRRNLEHAEIRLISIDDGIDTKDPDAASMPASSLRCYDHTLWYTFAHAVRGGNPIDLPTGLVVPLMHRHLLSRVHLPLVFAAFTIASE